MKRELETATLTLNTLLLSVGLCLAGLSADALAQRGTGATPEPALQAAPTSSKVLTLIVMDPLSAKLACDCVQGYAQRDYEKVGYYLSTRMGRPVHVVFGETLSEALEESKGKFDLVIGKHSVVVAGAKEHRLQLEPTFRLKDRNDSVEQSGLFVVRAKNKAKSVDDLEGYRILFGPAACDEKYAAPRALLEEHGIELPDAPPSEDICSSCSVAAKMLMEVSDEAKIAGVISSYAQPLLEGCGNIQKGDLRVIGESKPVPFVSVFFNRQMPNADQERLIKAFEDVELNADLLTALETETGFARWEEAQAQSSLGRAKELKPMNGESTFAAGNKDQTGIDAKKK
jgi:ABC-type phosphate/phosphonate transport system substrate-binding protein